MRNYDFTLSYSPRPITNDGFFFDPANREFYSNEAIHRRRMRAPQDVLEPIRQTPTRPEAIQTTLEGIRAVRQWGRDYALPVFPDVPESYVNFLGLLRQLDPDSAEISPARRLTINIAMQQHDVDATQIVEMIKDFGVIGNTEVADILFNADKRRSILAALLTIERQMTKEEALKKVDEARETRPDKVVAFLAEEVLSCSLNGAAMTTMAWGIKAATVKGSVAGAAAHAAHLSASAGFGVKVGTLLKAGAFGGIAGMSAVAMAACAVSTAKAMFYTIPDNHPEAFFTKQGADRAILGAILESGKFV